MHDKMMKMLMGKKKEGKTLSDSEKKSKLQALTGMRDMASGMMGDKLKNLKKVTVASDSQPGLKKGLHQAEDLLDQSPQDNEQPDSDPNNMSHSGYAEGGNVAKMPSEFDTDMDHVKSEHEYDEKPRTFSEGGMAEGSPEEEASESADQEAGEHDSIDELVNESPEDPDKLDEFIKKLEEKRQSLQK